ncbi:MAG TPA: hypothetical protein VFI42_15140 [Thermomicrobiaceae bacterium]|nr:hypothetical protein [Thermomicrobiaceae bacterium]
MEKLLAELDMLRRQLDAALENAAQGARESHESWTQRLETAESIGAELSARGKEEIQEERRREMLCLGQAAGLAWVAMRLARIVDNAEHAASGERTGPPERIPQAAPPPELGESAR